MSALNRSYRTVVGALAGAALAGAALLVGSAATAAPGPCAASEIAKTIGSVAANTGEYLDEHPDADRELSVIAAQPAGPASVLALKTFFDANPQTAADLRTIQKPLTMLTSTCKLPFNASQMLGLASGPAPATAPAETAPLPGPATVPPQTIN